METCYPHVHPEQQDQLLLSLLLARGHEAFPPPQLCHTSYFIFQNEAEIEFIHKTGSVYLGFLSLPNGQHGISDWVVQAAL